MHDNDYFTSVGKHSAPGGRGCQIKIVLFYPFLDVGALDGFAFIYWDDR